MNAQEKVELHFLAQSIAPLIGYEYETSRNVDADRCLRDVPHLSSPKGELYISKITYGTNKGRLEISISYPHSPLTRKTYSVSSYRVNGRKSEITVSGCKAPSAIANDIKRRLLPDLESLYAEARADMESDITYKTGKQATAERIAALIGKTITPRQYEEDREYSFYFFGSDADVTVSGPKYIKVRLDLKSPDEFEQLLEALKQIKKGQAHA